MTPTNKLALSSLFLAGLLQPIQAAITPYSSDFSKVMGPNSIEGWAVIDGTAETAVVRVKNLKAASDTDHNDLLSQTDDPLDGNAVVGDFTGDTEATGDGVANDGTLSLDVADQQKGNESMAYTCDGSMKPGERYALSISWINGTSFSAASFQLYNATDGRVLTELKDQEIRPNSASDYKPTELVLNYQATEADRGDQLQIRVVENGDHPARDVKLDQVALKVIQAAGIPESSMYAAILGLLALAVAASYRRR